MSNVTGVVTLTDFLLARIAEDEAAGPRHRDDCDALCDMYACSCDGATRVLADCEAKRRTLEVAQLFGCAKAVARYLALPYADHPDYREDWKP